MSGELRNRIRDKKLISLFREIKGVIKTQKNRYASHGFDHLLRVFKIVTYLSRKEGGNLRLLLPAALLHDLVAEKGKKNNAIRSAQVAGRLLKKVGFPKEDINKIKKMIVNHEFKEDTSGLDLDSQLLYEADKLDLVSHIGIVRYFIYCGEIGLSPLESIKLAEKYLNILKKTIRTKTGKMMLRKRLNSLQCFLKGLENEMKN